MLVDQNLVAALYSTIRSTFLPYVLNLYSCAVIWQIICKETSILIDLVFVVKE